MSSTTNRLGLRRKILLGTSVFMMAALCAVGAASCGGSLPDVQAGQCGNFVVEPDNGEACDDKSPKCGQPWEIGACRELCVYGGRDDEQCKPGFGCGLDGVCRKSDGLAALPISIAGGDIQKLLRGDFDGDGRDDVVAVGSTTADVHFLTTEGNVAQTVTLPNEMRVPAVGDINADTLTDIVLSLDRAVGVLQGQLSRTFQPENYPILYVEPQTYRLVPLGAAGARSATLALRQAPGKTYFDLVELLEDSGHQVQQVKQLAMPANQIASVDGEVQGAIGIRQGGSLDGFVCGAAAFEAAGVTPMSNKVYMAKGCATVFDVTSYSLNGDFPWGGAYLEDADKSGTIDLIYGSSDKSGVIAKLNVIRTDMNGDPLLDMNNEVLVEKLIGFDRGNCDHTDMFPAKLASPPLAVGDLNGDGYPDLVDNRGVLLRDPGDPVQTYKRTCHSYYFQPTPMVPDFLEAWSTAVIGDFNGDGRNDVLAARIGDPFLDLWMWQPGGFNTIPISVGAPVAELVVGDFDGNSISDAMFRLQAPPDDQAMAPIFVMFGNAAATPSIPKQLGNLHDVAQLAAGRIRGTNASGDADVLSDLLILSSKTMDGARLPLTLFQGNATQNLVSPLTLQSDTTSDKPLVMTDPINSIAISDFAWSACTRYDKAMNPMTDEDIFPANVIAVGESRIWFAGCDDTGSSKEIAHNFSTSNLSLFFAPVDRKEEADAMAVFMGRPTGNNSQEVKLGIIERQGQSFVNDTLSNLTNVPADIVLPTKDDLVNAMHAPSLIEDLDGNGFKDIVLIGQSRGMGMNSMSQDRNIYVFWNGNGDADTGTLSANEKTTMTKFPFGAELKAAGVTLSPDLDIRDIAALNIDGDPYLELAILTRNTIYLAKLSTMELSEEAQDAGEIAALLPERPFTLLPTDGGFEFLNGGQALLALDADSNGIDDLLVADMGTLQLYLGTERLR